MMDLLSADDFESLSLESESGDTMALLNEILSATNPLVASSQQCK
jgi:hypothetical protein